MKKIAIVCDNYKVEKFESELKNKGFTDFETKPYVGKTSVIKVNTPDEKVFTLGALVSLLESQFKRMN